MKLEDKKILSHFGDKEIWIDKEILGRISGNSFIRVGSLNNTENKYVITKDSICDIMDMQKHSLSQNPMKLMNNRRKKINRQQSPVA